MSIGLSVVGLRGCMGPDELPLWRVRGVIGIVVLIDGSSNRQSSAFSILLNRFVLAATMPRVVRQQIIARRTDRTPPAYRWKISSADA